MFKRLLRETWPGRAITFLPELVIRPRQLEQFLDDQLMGSGQGSRSIVVTGPSRIGKSTVAAEVAHVHGLKHVNVDPYTSWLSIRALNQPPLWFVRTRDRVRTREALRLADSMMQRSSRGCVVDAQLLCMGLSAAPRRFASLIREGRIIVFSSTAGLDERLAAIQVDRETGKCWTSPLGMETVQQIAYDCVRDCRTVNDLADRYDFPVHMLDCHAFETSTRAAAGRIVRMLSGQSAPKPLAAE